MNQPVEILHEQQIAKAFDKQSSVFDEVYSRDKIIQYKRNRVRKHVNALLHPQSKILELNAGTGEDAIYFASHGHTVHATDISAGMQKTLIQKLNSNHAGINVTTEICSFTQLENLKNKGPFDLIFSNFAGLNCTNQLDKVMASFSSLLKPGGMVTIVILPKFCLWETLLVFKGKFKTSFRRFFSSQGRKTHIEGEYFLCWYYNPSTIKKYLRSEFEILQIEGLCTLVPPSYIENFGDKYPKAFNFLKKLENRWRTKWPWRSIGDYYIISLQKKISLDR
jgi:ubiquinone/menaquinone biosynthesis C-methylase UbiE